MAREPEVRRPFAYPRTPDVHGSAKCAPIRIGDMLAWFHRHKGKLALLGAAVAGMGGRMEAKEVSVSLCTCRQLPRRSVAAAEGWRTAAEAAELRAGEHEVRTLGSRSVRECCCTAPVESLGISTGCKDIIKTTTRCA